MYKTFTFSQRSSYRLDDIAEYEVGEKKISYEGTLNDLYDNDINKFVEYNLQDVKLIDKLDKDNIPLFSVSEKTREITDLLEYRYSYIKVKGEISQETGDKYPEIYFTLKDEENVISGIIKRNKVPQLKFLPEVGLEVICSGKITAWTKKDSKFLKL